MCLAQKIFEILEGKYYNRISIYWFLNDNFNVGTWRIYRSIKGTGYLCGYSIFEINPKNYKEIFYSENGIFYFNNGKTLEVASKKYIYKFENDDIYVYDNNGILFHHFGIKNVSNKEEQRCFTFNSFHLGNDAKFHISYDFNLDNDQEFSIIHDVKSLSLSNDYISITKFKRIKEII